MRGDVAEVAVGEADDEVAVPEETVVDDAAVLGFEDELEGLFGGLEVVEQDVPLADDAAERLLLLVLFAVLDLELRPADFLDLEAQVRALVTRGYTLDRLGVVCADADRLVLRHGDSVSPGYSGCLPRSSRRR